MRTGAVHRLAGTLFATSLALNFEIDPSSLRFNAKTKRDPLAIVLGGNFTRSHVFIRSNVISSYVMAALHSFEFSDASAA